MVDREKVAQVIVAWNPGLDPALARHYSEAAVTAVLEQLREPSDQRPYPALLDNGEASELLKRAEQLWSDLQANNLGGYSGINRPFYILNEFKRVIEEFGGRDVGLHWSKDQLDAHPDRPIQPPHL